MSEIKLVKRLKYAGDVHTALMKLGWSSEMAALFLNSVPDAKVTEPVRPGRWEVKEVNAVVTLFACSECSREVSAANDYFNKPTKHIAKIYPYCHCGAKMDGADT